MRMKDWAAEGEKMHKILIYMQSLNGGGAERTVINLANHLDRSCYKIIFVIGNLKTNAYEQFISEDIVPIDLQSTRMRYSFFKLRKILVKENPDIILTTLYDNNILVSLINATRLKKSALIIREANTRSQSGTVSWINKIATKISYNNLADGLIAPSKGVKDDLIKNFGVLPSKIKVIYNPVDLNAINALKLQEVEDLEKKNNSEMNVVAVGRLDEQKDYPTLLKAISIVMKKYPVNLHILGTGPLEVNLKNLASALGIRERIKFLGFVKNPYKYLASADLFVLSSKWEGFAHVIVEAMVCQVPVIATNCKSGPDEIIDNGQDGRIVNVGDYEELAVVIEEMLTSNTQLYVQAGMKKAEFFNAPKITKEYEDYFMEVLAKS